MTFFRTDYIVRGTAASGMIRALAITAAGVVRTLQQRHDTSELATAALGRLSMATLLMSALLKNEGERIALSITCEGPLRNLSAIADTKGNVKGYAAEPAAHGAHSVACKHGALNQSPDVAAGIGAGTLTVVREIPHVEPFVSQIVLANGTISDDLTAYFMLSEQIPTLVGLDVALCEDGHPNAAGGYLIQLMPGYDENLPERLMGAISTAEPLESMVRRRCSPEEMLGTLLTGLDFVAHETMPVQFRCDCSRKFAERTLLSLGARELRELIESGESTEICCDYCNERYGFSPHQLQSLLNELS